MCLLAVHCSSRYIVTVYHPASVDWDDLPEPFLLSLRYTEARTSAYLRRSGAPELTKTHGRSEVAFLSRAWDNVLALDYAVDQSVQGKRLLDRAVNAVRGHCTEHVDKGASMERLRRNLAAIG